MFQHVNRVTVIGPNLLDQSRGDFHVHAAGCADIARSAWRDPMFDQGWSMNASSRLEIAGAIYEDIIAENEGSSAADYLSTIHFAPCVTLPERANAEVSAQLEAECAAAHAVLEADSAALALPELDRTAVRLLGTMAALWPDVEPARHGAACVAALEIVFPDVPGASVCERVAAAMLARDERDAAPEQTYHVSAAYAAELGGEPQVYETTVQASSVQEAEVEAVRDVARCAAVLPSAEVGPALYAAARYALTILTRAAAAETDAALAEAGARGREAGINAGAWAADGNSSVEHIRRVLAMLDAGDPAADEFLPSRPDLSGEWAGAETPQSLARDIVGAGSSAELESALAEAWEQGRDETFESSCEATLRRYLPESDDGKSLPREDGPKGGE